MSMNFLGHKNY